MLLIQPLVAPLLPPSAAQPPDRGERLHAMVTKAILLGLRNLGPQGCHLCQTAMPSIYKVSRLKVKIISSTMHCCDRCHS